MTEARESLNSEDFLALYREMVKIRKFEEEVYYLFLQRILPGTIHQYIGQEAVAVGICRALRRDDFITSTHRPHGHALAKGISPRSVFAELFAKEEGCCRARGGSMHLGDPDVGMLPAIAIAGGGLTLAPGIGLAFKRQGTDRVVACFFGEGASNEGSFHEGMNLAAVLQLPVIFVCENNLWAVSTPWSEVSRLENVADRAASYGIPGLTADGMDVLAMYDAAQQAVDRARAGDGPTLIEAKTYRLCGHSRFDPRTYRSKEEEAIWAEKDPIRLFEAYLRQKGVADKEIIACQAGVDGEIKEAIEYARQLPDPAPETALDGVFV